MCPSDRAVDAGCVEDRAQKESKEGMTGLLVKDADCGVAGETVERGPIAEDCGNRPTTVCPARAKQSGAKTWKKGKTSYRPVSVERFAVVLVLQTNPSTLAVCPFRDMS